MLEENPLKTLHGACSSNYNSCKQNYTYRRFCISVNYTSEVNKLKCNCNSFINFLYHYSKNHFTFFYCFSKQALKPI